MKIKSAIFFIGLFVFGFFASASDQDCTMSVSGNQKANAVAWSGQEAKKLFENLPVVPNFSNVHGNNEVHCSVDVRTPEGNSLIGAKPGTANTRSEYNCRFVLTNAGKFMNPETNLPPDQNARKYPQTVK